MLHNQQQEIRGFLCVIVNNRRVRIGVTSFLVWIFPHIKCKLLWGPKELSSLFSNDVVNHVAYTPERWR